MWRSAGLGDGTPVQVCELNPLHTSLGQQTKKIHGTMPSFTQHHILCVCFMPMMRPVLRLLHKPVVRRHLRHQRTLRRSMHLSLTCARRERRSLPGVWRIQCENVKNTKQQENLFEECNLKSIFFATTYRSAVVCHVCVHVENPPYRRPSD